MLFEFSKLVELLMACGLTEGKGLAFQSIGDSFDIRQC